MSNVVFGEALRVDTERESLLFEVVLFAQYIKDLRFRNSLGLKDVWDFWLFEF